MISKKIYQTSALCPRCGKPLWTSDVEGYKYVCFDCDENFCWIEVEESKIGDLRGMYLKEFLRTRTNVYELCVIREDGWIIASCWIGHEDLFVISDRIRDKVVKGEQWGYLTIVNKNNAELKVPCHYIDI